MSVEIHYISAIHLSMWIMQLWHNLQHSKSGFVQIHISSVRYKYGNVSVHFFGIHNLERMGHCCRKTELMLGYAQDQCTILVSIMPQKVQFVPQIYFLNDYLKISFNYGSIWLKNIPFWGFRPPPPSQNIFFSSSICAIFLC